MSVEVLDFIDSALESWDRADQDSRSLRSASDIRVIRKARDEILRLISMPTEMPPVKNDHQALIFTARSWSPRECSISPRGASNIIHQLADALAESNPEPPTEGRYTVDGALIDARLHEPPADDEREAMVDAIYVGVGGLVGSYIPAHIAQRAADHIIGVWRNRHRGPITDALREYAERLGVDSNPEHDDEPWWQGYRQAQRDNQRAALEAAEAARKEQA